MQMRRFFFPISVGASHPSATSTTFITSHRAFPINDLFLLTFLLFLSSSDVQGQFTRLFPRYPTDGVLDVVFVDSTTGFYSSTAGSLFGTTDCGSTWELRAHYQGDPVSLIKFVDPSLAFAASPYGGLWFDKVNCLVSSNGGRWWSPVDVHLADAEDFLPVSRSILLKATGNGIDRLDNFFSQWERTYTLPRYFDTDLFVPYGSVHQISKRPGGDIIALASYWRARHANIIADSVSLFLRSRDNGSSWDTLWQGSKLDLRSTAFATEFVGWIGGEHEALFKTSNGGASWALQHLDTLAASSIRKIIAFDTSRAVAVTGTGAFFRTSDGGTTWSKTVIETIWDTQTSVAFPTGSVGFYGGSELFRTLDGGSTWQPVNNSLHETANHIEFVNKLLGWVSTDKGLHASTDGGSSWSLRNNFTVNPAIEHFDFVDSLTGWGVGQKVVMKTSDGGYTWASTPLDPTTEYVRGVQFHNKDLGVVFEVRESGSNYSSILVTSDGGMTWVKRAVTAREFLTSWFKMKFTDPEHLWFANQQGLWLSRDTAQTWQLFDSVTAFNSGFDMADSQRGFCDNGHRAFGFTSDGGGSWTFTDKPYPNQTLDLAIIDPFTAGIPPAILAGYDGTLLECFEGFDVRALNTYTLDRLLRTSVVRTGKVADVWVLGSTFQVFHASYLITDVTPHRSANPAIFGLAQNYPNPFNPSTTIGYIVPGAGNRHEAIGNSWVRLAVYDLLGREVALLVDEKKAPGSYEVKFDASGLSSGVYIYRLEAGSFIQTRKMIFLK